MIDKWQEIYYALTKNKIRTVLTAFGVFWGIFMLVIMLGSGDGLKKGMFNILGDFATNSLFIWTQRTTEPYKGFPKDRAWYFTNEDTKALRENIDEIEVVVPRINPPNGNQLFVNGRNTGSFNVNGDYPEINRLDPVTIIEGRFLNYLDLIERRKVVVIGTRVKDLLFVNDSNVIGKYIQISGMYFQVVGIFKSRHTQDWGRSQNESVYMPFTTMQKAYNIGNIVYYYGIMIKPEYRVSQAEEKIRTLLAKSHHVSPTDKQAFGSENVEYEFNQMNNVFKGINILTWFVGIMTLIAGVIGVSNIMLVIIKERTKEIGIQRAIGATPANIMSQIVLESVFLTFIAGFIGMIFGIAIIEILNIATSSASSDSIVFLNPEVNLRSVISAIFLLIIAGAIAGSLPARRALRIKPIEAIRTEL